MKLSRLILVGVVAVAFASCCNCRKTPARSQVPITGSEWQVVQMDGRSFKAEGDAFTLTFAADKRVTGKGDCNRINGTYSNDNSKGTLSFGPMISTRIMCPDQASEDKFLRLLNDIDAYTIDGRMLMLFTKGEQKIMLERK